MSISNPPSMADMDQLHDDLKNVEIMLASYLDSPAAQQDPNFSDLAKLDVKINLQIFNLSVSQLQLAGANIGPAVDAINLAVASLKVVVDKKVAIEKDLTIVQSLLTFVTAVGTGNIGQIVSAGGALAGQLQAA